MPTQEAAQESETAPGPALEMSAAEFRAHAHLHIEQTAALGIEYVGPKGFQHARLMIFANPQAFYAAIGR